MNQNRKDVKILLTGGHAATTGIATVESIKKRYPDAQISWVGPKYELSGSRNLSIGYKIYPLLGLKYYVINAGKLQTKLTRYSMLHLILIPVGFFQALYLVLKLRPDLIVSFGGFSSFPIIFWGYLFGIPVVLHEQTIVAGRASMAGSFFATKIALARPESLRYFPKSKSVVIGNPTMTSILSVTAPKALHSPPAILVMGGSRGSEFINEEFFKIRNKLSKYKIVHITGERDYTKYKSFEDANYKVISFVDPRDMYKYYELADLIIGRSGANSVTELLFVKRPAILIPLPRTFMDEQVRNAEYAQELGIAKVMLEKEINPESLLTTIENIFLNWSEIIKKISLIKSPDEKASEKLVDMIDDQLT